MNLEFVIQSQFSSVQSLSHVRLCNPMDCSMSGFSVHHQLPEFAQTHVHWVSSIQPSHPLSSPSPPAFNLSQHQGLFLWVSLCIRWPKYFSFCFSFSISPSNEYSGLISFRIDWFDLLAVQGTLKSLLQHQQGESYLSNKESEAPRAFNTFQSGGNRRWFQEQVASLDSWYRELFLDVVRRVRCWQQGWVWWDLGRDGER